MADEKTYDAAGGAFEWAAPGNTVIGRGQYDGRYVNPFLGRIDEVYLFQGVLSAKDVCRVRDDKFLAHPPKRGTVESLAHNSTITLDVQNVGGRVSPLLFGHNLEHTRRAVWQGLSAELIANRKFADTPGANGVAAHWRSLDGPGVRFALDGPPLAGTPSQRIVIAAKEGGIAQSGIPLQRDRQYRLRVWLHVERRQQVSLRLSDAEGKETYAETTSGVLPGRWQAKTLDFKSPQTDTNARLAITLDGPGVLSLGAASLLPRDNFHGMRRDVVTLLKQMGVRLLRWPGGNFTRDYRWQDGLLPVEQRPPIKINCAETQPFSDNWDFHEIGIDEFLALCRELDAEPALTLNIDPKICTPEAAAAWVEYCNGSRRTTWGEVRANRGHPRPYHVKYWFVGNEIWGDWMGAAHSDAATYAQRLPQYASAIRKVDPSVLLIASGLSPEWDRTLIAQAGSSFDLLSEHNYAPEGNAHAPHPASADFAGLPHFPKGDLLSMLQTAQRTEREAAPRGCKIRTVFDEWNVWHNWFVDPSHNEWHVGPIDACFAAAMLNMFCREADNLDMVFAAYFQPVQEGAIRVQPFSAELTPVGQVFALFRIHQAGRRLRLDIPRGLGIDGFASLSANGRNARVTLVNTRGEQETMVQLALPNARQIGDAALTSLTAKNLVPDVPLQRHTDRIGGERRPIPCATATIWRGARRDSLAAGGSSEWSNIPLSAAMIAAPRERRRQLRTILHVAGEPVVEIDVIIALLAGAGGHRVARMLVQLAGDVVLHERAPFHIVERTSVRRILTD